ncbi:Uncharacterized protein dnl_14970 [Desulfonema limicola]|uniref:Uncharacterized protein n=1 Tax=Desulfonema limicola TaxID=45656 RepID=A0A975GFF4_9BACT|nr:Uncharacterized protein dnl_14970 [Desulfonema limicola]
MPKHLICLKIFKGQTTWSAFFVLRSGLMNMDIALKYRLC